MRRIGGNAYSEVIDLLVAALHRLDTALVQGRISSLEYDERCDAIVAWLDSRGITLVLSHDSSDSASN